MAELRHTLQTVSNRTGLSPHVIRVWERRYGAVSPGRSEGNQRRYSDGDLRRLTLLSRATRLGHRIGTVAELATDQLEALVDHLPGVETSSSDGGSAAPAVSGLPVDAATTTAARLLRSTLEAVAVMDGVRLEELLERGSVELGQTGLLLKVVVPLVEQIGEGWRTGALQIAHEHVASAVLRTYLGTVSRPMALHPTAPVLVATTPTGQLHELGAILAAALAATQGWRVVYAGPSLPAAEIAATARQHAAGVVALSLVHPSDDREMAGELTRLRRLLPSSVAVIAGGRAAAAYRDSLEAIGAIHVENLDAFLSLLHRLRREPQ